MTKLIRPVLKRPATPKKPSVIAKLVADARKRAAAEKLRRIDCDVLTVQGVAEYLHCSEMKVRAIPEDHLPRYFGPGRRLLYFKEDVHRYLRSNGRRKGAVDDDIVGRAKARAVGSLSDSGRRRSPKKETDQ